MNLTRPAQATSLAGYPGVRPSREPVRRLATAAFVLLVIGCHAAPASIFEAVETGRVQAVQDYLRRGGDANARDPRGMPLIVLSVGPHGSCAVTQFLMRDGADVNATGPNGQTALMEAAMWTDAECVRVLLASGADPNRREDGTGYTALMLVGNDGGAASQEIARALLAHGADPALTGRDGRTARSHFLALGREDVARLLDAHGRRTH